MMLLTPDLVGAIQAHALAAYPEESCGVIADGLYHRLRNRKQNPEAEFEIAEEDFLRFEERLQAIVHSHPNGNDWPSIQDMRGQIDTAVPWVIVVTDGRSCRTPFAWGDQLPLLPLRGRQFRHGVQDCYSLIRDVYRLGREHIAMQDIAGWPHDSIQLPEFPRGGEWWREGCDLYRQGFEQAGFVRVMTPEPGDVFLAQIRSPVPNHGGVLLERSLVLHHLQARLSRIEPLSPWQRMVTHWLRYKG